MQVWSLGWEDPLEEEMTTLSSIPAWRITRTEEPGGLQSMGSQKSQSRLSYLTATTSLPLESSDPKLSTAGQAGPFL